MRLLSRFFFAALVGATATAAETDTERLASVAPTAAQLKWQSREIEALVHFGMNTYTGREWGVGREDPRQFNPAQVDPDQWVRAAKSFGAKALILVCKHHDGFCLWPSAFTEHSVKHSPWRGGGGDLVREVADACRKGGLEFGVYVSPADMHEPSYGRHSAVYSEFFCNQLTELLTRYGEVCQVFFDGGEPGPLQQAHDWQRYYQLIRRLQPNAVISIRGPDVRWVGNEVGTARQAEWSVIPLPRPKEKHDWTDLIAEDLGSRNRVASAPWVHWYPAVADVSLRRNWFWRPKTEQTIKSLSELIEIYERSVGRNAGLQLNLSPDLTGRIPEPDLQRLQEFGDALRSRFATNLCQEAQTVVESRPDHGMLIQAALPGPSAVRYVVLQEDITRGQRVEEALVTLGTADGTKPSRRVMAVGWKRIIRFEADAVTTIQVEVLQSRGDPHLTVSAY